MITTIALIVTSVWVLIGATIVMPYFVNRKLKKAKTIEKLQEKAVTAIEEALPKIIESPKMQEVLDKFKKDTIEGIPTMIVNAFNSEEFEEYMGGAIESGVKRIEGALYRNLGLEKEEVEKGIQLFTQAVSQMPEGGQLQLPEGMGAFAPMIEQFLSNTEMSPIMKMGIMFAIQKFMPAMQGNKQTSHGAGFNLSQFK